MTGVRKKCIVKLCPRNTCYTCKQLSGLAFHLLPRSNDVLRRKWLVNCQRTDLIGKQNIKNLFVCGRHFTINDYSVSAFRRRLVENAVPVINSKMICPHKQGR